MSSPTPPMTQATPAPASTSRPSTSEGEVLAHPLAPSTSNSSRPVDARISTSTEVSPEGSTTPPVPKCHLRVLIISGQSHVFSFEPETTVGRTKELIWSMWPADWKEPAQPPSAAYLRILHAGRVLGDDSTLGSNNIPSALAANNPTVIHISVRSFSISPDDAEAKKGLHATNSRTRNGDNGVGGCRCVIM